MKIQAQNSNASRFRAPRMALLLMHAIALQQAFADDARQSSMHAVAPRAASEQFVAPVGAVTSRLLEGRFVRFSIFTSPESIVEVRGVRLGMEESEIPSYGQLSYRDAGGQWRPLGIHVPLDVHGGKVLARLPVTTLRFDSAEGTCDLYAGTRLVQSGLPAEKGGGPGQLVIHAGFDGTLINSVTTSDENPLFTDRNHNGIDDGFEQRRPGGMAASEKADRKALLAEWRAYQRRIPAAAPTKFVQLPRPDPGL